METVSIEQAIEFLNNALTLDRKAITNLCNQRVICNFEILNHPTIQAGWWPKDGSMPDPGSPNENDGKSEPRVGIIGIINGLFGVDEDGWGFIAAHYDESGLISKFERTKCQNLK